MILLDIPENLIDLSDSYEDVIDTALSAGYDKKYHFRGYPRIQEAHYDIDCKIQPKQGNTGHDTIMIANKNQE